MSLGPASPDPGETAAEAAVDRAIHLFGVPAGVAASVWLIASVELTTPRGLDSLFVYAVGLVGMLAASAAYHLSGPGRTRDRLRRLDQAMIFVMIAGTYTPFTLNALPPAVGLPLCAAVWGIATFGIGLKLLSPRRLERLSLALYLGMGWMALCVIPSLVAALPGTALILLLLGGIAYTVGSMIFYWPRVPFQNAIWHGLVLLGVGLHLAALSLAFGLPA